MGDDLLPELGDLVFSMLIGYAGALEFLYVVRHLYHWTCGHSTSAEASAHNLKQLQNRMRSELAEAVEREQQAGTNVMQDGVLYKDGFRVSPQQDTKNSKAVTEQRRKEIEIELEQQKQIEEQTRRELEKAEADLLRQQAEEEENIRKLLEAERQREEEEHNREIAEAEAAANRKVEEEREAEENARKQREEEAERIRKEQEENERRQQIEEEENVRKLLEVERQREEEEHNREIAEAEATAKRKVEENARKQREEETQRLQEEEAERVRTEHEENERKLFEAERQREMEEQQREMSEAEAIEKRKTEAEQDENERLLLEVAQNKAEDRRIKEISTKKTTKEDAATAGQHEAEKRAVEESLLRMLDAESDRQFWQEQQEQERSLIEAEREFENRQRQIEENARKFLESDLEMEELQQRMLESAQQLPIQQRRLSATESAPQTPIFEEPCIRKTISPLTDDTSASSSNERVTPTVKTQFGQTSNEPYSVTTKPLLFKSISDDTSSIEPPSTLSAQQSEEFATGTEDAPNNTIDIQFTQLERQDPEGEDNDQNASQQYTDDYLRSLDGIKNRPLIREDGSGRRRAFKMRRSSGSSNSSRGSREEEVKMFTSLEEEELQSKKEGESDFTPIKYTSEPLLKVKGHRRRHKRSPAKDVKPSESNTRGSLEMLNEESTNPWGEMPPEHYKDMPFWKREKSMSIDEEQIELGNSADKKEIEEYDGAKNIPNTASFEDATHTQNEEAITTLQKQQTNEKQDKEQVESTTMQEESARSEINPNLQTSQQSGSSESGGRSSASPRLRRSPRIDEIDHYEEHWMETTETKTSATSAAQASTTPSTPSIIIHHPIDNAPWRDQHGLMMEGLSDFYDFTASVNPSRSRSTSRQASPVSTQPNTPTTENIKFIPSSHSNDENKSIIDVYDDTGSLEASEITKANIVNFIESLQEDCSELSQILVVADNYNLQNVANTPNEAEEEVAMETAAEMKLLVQTLRVERARSKSRSHSPLPTNDNLEKNLENRRSKLVKHNDEIFEKLNISTDNASAPESLSPAEEDIIPDNMNSLVSSLRLERTKSKSRSRSPLPNADNVERSLNTRRCKRIKQNDELLEKLRLDISSSNELQNVEDFTPSDIELSPSQDYMTEDMNSMVKSMQLERSRSHSHSRSRSRSPLPTPENLERSLEKRRNKLIQQNDELFEKLNVSATITAEDVASSSLAIKPMTPIISVERCDEYELKSDNNTSYPREEMNSLIESLRLRRSCSKSPMRRMEREKTPEPFTDHSSIRDQSDEEREQRSRTPSRSTSMSPSRLPSPSSNEYFDFHMMLNLEASQNRTLSKPTEEMETMLAEKQRLIDEEALRKLSTASEEMELRTITPTDIRSSQQELDSEEKDRLSAMKITERMRQLRCSPTTPDYDRSISSEWRDVQRIKEEMINSGFQRSTYAGESLDLGSEFEPLRESAARFQRSRSPSPSHIDTDEARKSAVEKREVQDHILSELVTASERVTDEDRLGAKPKEMRSLPKEQQESQYDEMRRINAEFQRSRSQSRSPLGDVESEEVAEIEMEALKRELEDKMLDGIEKTNVNFHEFSRYLNAGFLDNERRASDSALIQKPEVLIQFQDYETDVDMEPEEYHHFRRFSLNQEQSVEEYPNDDYVYVSQIEVQTPNGTRTWIREDYYSDDFEKLNIISEESAVSEAISIENVDETAEQQMRGEEDETDGSEDERRTVVDVEDEIDEDICDFNERGPADESHHETSECEEAEREMDRYADRNVDDWRGVEYIDELLEDESNLSATEEGAVGGIVATATTVYDSDSVAIDQIYDEAIKNRKQSGILRDYDSILNEMQQNYVENSTTDNSETDSGVKSGSDRYAMGTNVRELNNQHDGNRKRDGKPSLQLIDNERREAEVRYLSDANIDARQSTRLRSRYGYVPLLHSNSIDDVDVDLNYKPKKEYKWRKNFKIEDEKDGIEEIVVNERNEAEGGVDEEDLEKGTDWRKFSLGGESITLFSQSPEKENIADAASTVCDNETVEEAAARDITKPKDLENEVAIAMDSELYTEKPKKKKSKKKSRKETLKESFDSYSRDEDDSENQIYSRRSSSIQMEMDSPKRKSRSRRNSKSSFTNDDTPNGLFSPRNSVGHADLDGELNDDTTATTLKKKTKKRKKAKDTFTTEPDIKEEHTNDMLEKLLEVDVNLAKGVMTASAAITPNTASINPLATLSPQNSISATPGSIDEQSDTGGEATPAEMANSAVTVATRTATTTTTTTRTTADTFDILKDANFYPLF